MKFMYLGNKKIISLFVLLLGTIWIYLNIFWSTFYVFAQGVYKPWLFLNGYVLFRDLIWNRAGFELYLLAIFYKLFGISPLNFQIFIFLVQSITGVVMFLLLRKKSFSLAIVSYVLYASLAFLIYGTLNESAEMLIGLFVFLVFYLYWEFIEKKSIKFLFLAGIATGFSLITKQTSLFIPFSVLILLLMFSRKKMIKVSAFYLLGALIPITTYALYFAFNNGLYDLYFNTIYSPLFPYRQNAPLWGLSEGIRIMILHLSLVVPFIFIKTKTITLPIKTALVLFTLSLFTTLLPTFWSYRLISALPIFSVMLAIVLLRGFADIQEHKNNAAKGIIIFGLITLFVQLGFYLNQSLRYIIEKGGFSKQQYILDGYLDDEKNIVRWLKKNTKGGEKVFNMATNFVLFLSNRFPAHKYDDSMYFGFFPLKTYYDTITKNPARIVIYDTNLVKDWKILRNWKYVEFLRGNYILTETFGAFEIYTLKRNKI